MAEGTTGSAAKEPKTYPYDEKYDPTWIKSVARTFRYRPWLDGWEYYGECPRCRHPTSKTIQPTYLERMAVPEYGRAWPATLDVPRLVVRCECRTAHAKDKTGCGYYGTLLNVHFE
jgi:hypothetical protein